MTNYKGLVDFHSHMIHRMDDGSKSLEESLSMIKRSSEMGVEHIALTPHFYPRNDDPTTFLERRERRYIELSNALPEGSPMLHLGAEVEYFDGIVQMESLRDFRIRGSKCLLIEMPFAKWTDRNLSDISMLSRQKSYRVVLAHIERYLNCFDYDDLVALVRQGVMVQSNAENFINIFTRKRAISMLSDGLIHFIGTDSHGLVGRAPNLDKAVAYIEKKLGRGIVDQISDLSAHMLGSVPETVGSP